MENNSFIKIINNYENGALVDVKNGTCAYISPNNYGCALPGDYVCFTINDNQIDNEIIKKIEDEGHQDQIICNATIKSIIKRAQHNLISGVLYIKSSTIYGIGKNGGKFYLFRPSDPKYPHFIVLSKINPSHYKKNIYATIKFISWNSTDKHPRGSCEQIIGEIGQIENEIDHRIYANQLVFPSIKKSTIKNEMDKLNKIINSEYLSSNRFDLSDKYVFSIDPPGCLDVDDALHIEKNEGYYSVGIHIADVSEWVQMDSPFDIYARQRMTSIYLPQKTHHMLPIELSENACSLIENQKRLTLSLLLDIDNDGKIIKYKFVPAIIQNRKQMTYENAENLIQKGDIHLNELLSVVKKIISQQQYHQSHSDQSNETNAPNAHLIVETFMIIANILCAEYLVKKYGDCILRVHEEMNYMYFNEHLSYLNENILTNKSDLENYLKLKSYSAAQYRTLKSLNEKGQQAKHFGLKTQYYTHFTSPIRRYIDLLNHRLIKNDNAPILDSFNEISELSNNIGKRTKKLYKDICYLTITNQLEECNKSQIISKGFIVDIIDNTPSVKIKVYLPEYKLTKMVTLCHYKITHLYDIDKSNKILKIIEKETGKEFKCSLYSEIIVLIIPILNSETFNKKLRLNIAMFD